ncbi:hypothetical protein IWQ62_004803 [Dispira parvispora]|uniref:SMP-30/Gluconolactonase/LRE-like region domain-containing protein n=1 Tax=Dispira parvispora TaxID=1520584 RepID=A0A9W8ALP4_9FUNG|nr:hypothetical protein IWQ62_004803 [Dispira parvispora]
MKVLVNIFALAVLGFPALTLAAPPKCDGELPSPGNGNGTSSEAKFVIDAAKSQLGSSIEGAATDKTGNFYTANFGNDTDKNTIAMLNVDGTLSLAYKDNNNETWFNSIRTMKSGTADGDFVMFAGDVTGHRVVKIEGLASGNPTASDFCKDSKMLQPNDMALSSDGNLYLSGMNYTETSEVGNGDLWWCKADGKAAPLDKLHRANGIEVSSDNKYLYLSEAVNVGGAVTENRIMRYEIDAETGVKLENKAAKKTVFVDFKKLDQTEATDIDGMRCDKDGNLFVTRNGLGAITVFSPDGSLKSNITVPGMKSVKNLEFSGADGKVLHIVGNCDKAEGEDEATPAKGCIATWTHEAEGLEWSQL